jgi:hypothetical protein
LDDVVSESRRSTGASHRASVSDLLYKCRMDKKSEIAEISRLVSIPDPGPGIGSSVYNSLFLGVCRRFGLDEGGSMPDRAERIVRAARLPYVRSAFDSRETASGGGSTVTLEGLQQIHGAVHLLIDRER